MGRDRDQLWVIFELRDLFFKCSPPLEDKKGFLNQLIETVELNFLTNKFRFLLYLVTFHHGQSTLVWHDHVAVLHHYKLVRACQNKTQGAMSLCQSRQHSNSSPRRPPSLLMMESSTTFYHFLIVDKINSWELGSRNFFVPIMEAPEGSTTIFTVNSSREKGVTDFHDVSTEKVPMFY